MNVWPRLALALALILLLLAGGGGSAAQGPGPPIYLPLWWQQACAAPPQVLIAAFLPDGQAANDDDEAIALQNTGCQGLDVQGWQISDGEGVITLPSLPLPPGETIWCTKRATAFRQQWGFDPACEYAADSDPAIPNATGRAPLLRNEGDEILLLRPEGSVADAVAFGTGDVGGMGWTGPAVAYYRRNTRFSREGQVFYRLFNAATGLALADTDRAEDWAQGDPDPARGRRAAYPGWDLQRFSLPARQSWSSPAATRLLVAPDNLWANVAALLASAQRSVWIEAYEFDHPNLVAILVERAAAGVAVRLLLEGAPTGGLSDQSRWAAQQIAEAGGVVHFMVNNVGDAADRYPYQHAKFALIDGETLLISSENFKTSSMPPDAGDGETWGRRGYALILHDPGGSLSRRLAEIFAADDDLAHNDIFPWQAGHATYGAPPPGYTPPPFEDQRGYVVRYPAAATLAAPEGILFSAPESSLSPGPLLDLIASAGPGDTILTQQLYEHAFWGPRDSTPAEDPNPRLEALIAAARRGARVRLLLDSFFSDPEEGRSNSATLDYVNTLAAAEGLDLRARLGNPAGGGLHAKLHLLALGAQRWIVLGSLNGGEVSNKLNREVMIAVASGEGFGHLAGVFWDDWNASPP